MPIRLTRHVFRERRRVLLVVVLTFAALRLAGPAALAHPLPAAVLALATGAAAGLVRMLAPGLRGHVEAMALAGLGFAGLVRALPGSALDLAGPAGNAPVAAAIGLGLVALARAARRALAALPLPRLHNRRFTARAGSRVDIYRLWHGLVPAPEPAARSDAADLHAVEEMSLRLGRVRLVAQAAPDPPRATHLQILEVEAPFHIRMCGCDGDGDGHGVMAASGISEIFLVELGPQRLVLFAHEFPEMPLGRALLAWLDDTPGRMLDRRLATIERRAWAQDADLPPTKPRPAGATALGDWDEDAVGDAPAAPEDPTGRRRVS